MADPRGTEKAPETTNRERGRAALLQQAMERPGTQDVIRVYESWKKADRGLDSHRALAGWRGTVTNDTDACGTG